jgi:hypothetical protein
MVVSYELAQLSTTARKLPRAGAALLVLGSGNVDEVRPLASQQLDNNSLAVHGKSPQFSGLTWSNMYLVYVPRKAGELFPVMRHCRAKC